MNEPLSSNQLSGKQHEGDCWDAQEQIERLTAERDAARSAMQHQQRVKWEDLISERDRLVRKVEMLEHEIESNPDWANIADALRTENTRLRAAGKRALDEMVRTVAPRDSFTEAVDQLDAALAGAAVETGT